jgi:hypothetical protein
MVPQLRRGELGCFKRIHTRPARFQAESLTDTYRERYYLSGIATVTMDAIREKLASYGTTWNSEVIPELVKNSTSPFKPPETPKYADTAQTATAQKYGPPRRCATIQRSRPTASYCRYVSLSISTAATRK